MAFRDIRRMVSEWYKINVKPRVESARSSGYGKELVLGVLGAVVIVGGYWGYRHYAASTETQSQIALAESIQIYREALDSKTGAWPHVEMKCASEYERNKRSSLAPYFLVIKADALLAQDRRAEAQALLEDVLAMLPKGSPLVSLYKTKYALIKLDALDDVQQRAGLDELRSLAHDKDNKNNDVAQYYLGLYYWSHNELDKAQSIWKELVASQAAERLASSPWAALAQEKLDQRPQGIVKANAAA